EAEAHAACARENGPLGRQFDAVRVPAVVEGGLAPNPDVDPTAQDADVSDEAVVPRVRPDVPHGHVVHDLGGPTLICIARHEDVRVGEVDLETGEVAVERDL